MRSREASLDFTLLRNLPCVVHLDAEIPGCAVQLGMPQQQLNGLQIFYALVARDFFGWALS